MDRLRRFIIESAFTEDFSRAVYEAAGIFEAVNINKAYLVKEAGTPEAFRDAKNRVSAAWADSHMDGVVRGANLLQKLFNFLYLMEIRKPGFADRDLMTKIHDVAIHGSLDQKFLSMVDSDTSPEQALSILDDANESAVQAGKPYPNLSAAEEALWNRVKVYHEFPDGFRWVYAVDAAGKVASYIPSNVTSKTMNHCGNQPSHRSGDQYWELRDEQGKAYLTVILNSRGEIEESKSWGNQSNKYRQQILPYVKWFLKDQKVTGVGDRYDNGYATHMNFGVKDFIGDDPEFIDYVIENKAELIGTSESKILFWQNALKDGYVTVDDLKNAYESGLTRSSLFSQVPGLENYAETARFQIRDGKYDPSNSVFGVNSFAVLCAACSGNPFTEKELISLISKKKISLEVFANYNIRLLTPEIQEAFVRADAENLDKLISISNQVAAFKVSPGLWGALVPSDAEVENIDLGNSVDIFDRCTRLIKMLKDANPPSKMADMARDVMSRPAFIKYMSRVIALSNDAFDDMFDSRRYSYSPVSLYHSMAVIIGRYDDVPLPSSFTRIHMALLASSMVTRRSKRTAVHDNHWSDWCQILDGDFVMGRPKNESLIAQYTDGMIENIVWMNGELGDYPDIKATVEKLTQLFGYDRILEITSGMQISDNIGSLGALATTLPKSPELAEFARTAVDYYFYSPGADGTFAWQDDERYLSGKAVRHLAVFDLLLHWDGMMKSLDWTDRRTFSAMAELVIRFTGSDMAVPKNELERVLVYFINELHRNIEIAKTLWDHSYFSRTFLVRKDSFPGALAATLVKYGIEDRIIPVFFREMAEIDMESMSNVVCPWTLFTIPFEEWEEKYRAYGSNFILGYVLMAPSDTMYENEFIPNFIINKLLDGGPVVDALIHTIDNEAFRRKKSCLSRLISKRIINNDYPMSDELFNKLYGSRMINAEAYRAVMGRREDRGAVEVQDTPTVANVIKAFASIQKLDTLPELIADTFKYLVGLMYANMGDGRYRWKVDENCSTEVGMLGTLSAKLASKAKVGNVPKAIKKLYDDGIVDRMRNFPAENRAACEVPNKPKSKITCIATGDINDAVFALDRVKDDALAAADKPAKAVKRKKPVVQ